MNKTASYPFPERLLRRAGGWHPVLVLIILQLINTPLMILLAALPTQTNAELSQAQGTSLLIFGVSAMCFRNIVLLVQFYLANKDLVQHLAKLHHPGAAAIDPEQAKRAWMQANTVAKQYVVAESLLLFPLVLIPAFLFGYFSLNLSLEQIIYFALAALTASIVNFMMGSLTLDQFFEPMIQTLLPEKFEAQLYGSRGVRLGTKFLFHIFGLVLISLLLMVPTAYHQVNTLFSQVPNPPRSMDEILRIIMTAGIGAVLVGVLLSFRLITYFNTPIRNMINLFKEVEKGDLNQRIGVGYSDEFGNVNIYLNHMIDRLQQMTSSLEQQVNERTAQLSQANSQLQVELTERKHAQDQLAYTALHDPLTDIPNRMLFMDRLQHVMERAKRHTKFTYAILFIDLDHFKVVNDSLGHNIGDLLLIETANRLKRCMRSEDTIARLGGDEFVILIEDLENTTDYIQVADRIQHELSVPADLENHKVFISMSMGIVVGDTRYERTEDVLRDADIAMYHAKKLGRGRYEVFEPAMLEDLMTRLELETDLRKAVENHEFVVHYQPILNLEDQRIIGYEALVRWQHPKRGLISPAEFIPIAEEVGLIVPIGYWILEEACRQMRSWQERFPVEPSLILNVNMSTRQCVELNLVERIAEILKISKLDARCLRLEITESFIIENSKTTAKILAQLRELGIQVQIDDFGTGYSSLGFLHALPIDTLKIDRMFIRQLGASSNGSEIVRMIMALAHSLGMKVVAEGVETDDQLSKLKEMDCEMAQGYLIAEPVDSQEVMACLAKAYAERTL